MQHNEDESKPLEKARQNDHSGVLARGNSGGGTYGVRAS